MRAPAKPLHARVAQPLQALLLCLCLQPAPAVAQPVAAPPQMQFEQRLDAQLPLSDTFTDDSGRVVNLGAFFNREPVVLIFGYYHCPNLCSTLMDGVMETLSEVGLPRHAYRVLGVSIDPTEDASLAARKKASYAGLVARAGGDLHLLTGSKAAIDTLASSAGFHYTYDPSTREYAHPAGFLISTPDGRIAHYFMGVRFDPHDVRLALIDASTGTIGSPVDKLLLLCSHYAPVNGRYSAAVMTMVRIGSLTVLAALVIWLWRKRRRAA